MSQRIIPYSFSVERIYPSFSGMTEYPQFTAAPVITRPGQAQGIYITLHDPDAAEETAAMFDRWFATRSEISVVDYGTSDKQGLGFIIVEYLECDVDQLFTAILNDVAIVADYTVYGRDLMEG
ncbi:hypothetical protein [Ktedonobacter racemifer]|uniref:Uncharacterized protein n=1 Tax=Ktedonobacter racemifer DSM 44963 TaxID=485913 RepID=D6U257_KTERA|nr:hypothetical protein [Ktedonobacter racemifer]EFH82725.1 hypothetical protein Krac_3568 [Ktedonobacter racemifer DSM 44963]